jgi:hypothetical protein
MRRGERGSTSRMAVSLLLAGALAALAGCGRDEANTTGASPFTASGAQSAESRAARLRDTPQARAWRSRLQFEQDARSCARDAPRLSTAERRARADRLEEQIRDRERAGELSAGESMLLRAAMIQAQTGSNEEQAQRLAALVQRYRQDAARREAAWTARLQGDPRMQRYKSREQDVVAEVMALDRIPAGLSRDEYLRHRLQEERERAWSTR